MSGAANRAGAHQLAALLGPDTIAAGEDPRRPVFKLSNGPPTMAVLPSADSATEAPCPALPSASADQLVVQLGPKTWSKFGRKRLEIFSRRQALVSSQSCRTVWESVLRARWHPGHVKRAIF